MKKLLVLGSALAVCAMSALAITPVKNHKPQGRIVVADTAAASRQAAELMQLWTKRITGAELPVVTAAKAKKNDLVISSRGEAPATDDGFTVRPSKGALYLDGSGKGAVYGAISLLERYAGCNYWSENEYTAPESRDLTFADVAWSSNPAFRYRQSQNYALATDPEYRQWMRLEEPGDEFANGYWVHTFNRLLPSAEYGKSHPEYYAYFNGKRQPGAASQWCLTNPEVVEIVAQRIDSLFDANPGKNIISVSQNDGNHTNCTCPECARIDSINGGPTGSLIYFLNKVAERRPDKQFSTLAYLYTMHPPKQIKPLGNVNIMLCDIDCYRETPLTGNASGQDFMKALTGWSKISDNIFVWDYGINFDGYLTPFPNFDILQPNIRIFRDNHVRMHFSQIAGSRGGDFAELRTWLVSKLMWNPDADMDSLMNVFHQGYYGAAAPYMIQYHKDMKAALTKSGKRLWIYDSPVTHKDGMLSRGMMDHYMKLYGQAFAAVAGDSLLHARVERATLPLLFSELEIARTDSRKDVKELSAKIDRFDSLCILYQVAALNERNNSPADYCALYRERYMPRDRENLATGATITASRPIRTPYDKLGTPALVDGIYGGATYQDSWIGWEGEDVTLTIDLGCEKEISSIGGDFLHQLGAWILLPKSVKYSTSTDGSNYVDFGTVTIPEKRDVRVLFENVEASVGTPVKARYIKMDIEGTKECPHWHYGVGNPCWFFLDEITVN